MYKLVQQLEEKTQPRNKPILKSFAGLY